MFISGIYSLNDEINKSQSGLSTGAVDIEIQEYNQNNQAFDKDGTLVMPGDEISLIPRIVNLGMDCYLRVKIDYTIDNEIFSVTDYIEGNYSSWTKKGDYYYYDSIFPKDGSVDLFNKVIIPNLSLNYNGKHVVVHTVVEAVQARNFNGNWNDVIIKESINRSYDIDYSGDSTIIYDNDTDHHIILDSGFFNNLGNMLPGDTVKETFKLLNSGKLKSEYYFSIDYNNLSNEELKLLQKMRLLVRKQSGEILVDSNLADKSKHSLGVYQKGKGDTFIIEVSLPNDVDNDFSKLFTKITWKFSHEELEQSNKIVPNISDNPKTLDNIDVSITVFLISAIGLLIDLYLLKRETDNIEKKDKKKG